MRTVRAVPRAIAAAAFALAFGAEAQDARFSPLSAPEVLTGDRTFLVEAASRPRLLRVFGRRAIDPSADAELTLDGKSAGRLSAYPEGPSRFAVSLPLPKTGPTDSRRGEHELRLRALPGAGDRVVLERVEVVDAARAVCIMRDQASKETIKGVFATTATDGEAPPLCGPIGGAPREGSAWISDDGHGELWVPLGTVATIVGYASPFRAAVKFRRRMDLAEGALLTFISPPDVRPPGARIVEPLRDHVRLDAARLRKDAALDVGLRVGPEWRVVSADEALADFDGFVASLESAPDAPVVVTNENGSRLAPERIKPLTTVRLADGAVVHSNGPLPLIDGLRREGATVRGVVDLRLPEDATLEAVYVRSGRVEHRLPTRSAGALPFEVEAAPGAPVVVLVRGPGFSTAPPTERPFAVRVFRAP